MSTETIKGGVSASLDTSHLKVPFPFKSKYGNYIGGKFVEPKSGKYFDNVSPINNEVICQMARSDAKDVDAALDAAHEAFKEWGKTDITTRSNIMNKIADVLEKNLNLLANAMVRNHSQLFPHHVKLYCLFRHSSGKELEYLEHLRY